MVLPFNVSCRISPVDTDSMQLADIGTDAPNPLLRWRGL